MISIIIPVYNAEKYIEKLIKSLLNQRYNKDFEIIVINNKSNDKTKEILNKYKKKIVYLEQNEVASSYVSRNIGIKIAKGDILAFTDSDCIIDKDWLINGEMVLKNNIADIVGGKVKFYFSENPSIAEYFDSIIYLRSKESFQKQHALPTLNLFVNKEVFYKINFFPKVKSGGDFYWTNKAYNEGYKLIYDDKVIVYHPARRLKELLHKELRLGSSVRNYDKSGAQTILNKKSFLKRITPFYSIKEIKDLAKGNDNEEIINKKIIQIWLVGALCKTTKLTAYFLSFFGYRHR